MTNKILKQSKYIFIGLYLLLIAESLFHVYRTKNTIASLQIEIIIGISILLIHIITAQFRSHKNNTLAERELSTLSKRIPCGVAKIKFNEDLILLYANDAFYHILGYGASEMSQVLENKTALLIHSADMASTLAELKNQANYSTNINIDYRIIHKTGEVRWIHLDAFFSEMAENVPVYQCIFTDITDFQKSLQQSEMEKERYRIISEISDDILFEYDIKEGTLTASQAFINFYGLDPVIPNFKETILKNHLVHHSDMEIFKQLCEDMDAGESKILHELRFRLSSDRFIWYQIQGTALTDKRGDPIKIIGKAVNIELQKQETESLTKKSQLDSLTGIYNKMVTGQFIDEYLKRENDKSSQSAFFIIDLDNFKGINDNLGHIFGDSVLVHISEKIKGSIRNTDIFGRIGGDEFVILLKDIRVRDYVVHKAEEIRSVFLNAYTGENHDYKISGSIGISLFPDDGNSYEELYKKADIALYKAKKGGKDRYEFYTAANDGTDRVNQKDTLHKIHNFPEESRLPVDNRADDLLYLHIFELFAKNSQNNFVLESMLKLIGDYYHVDRAYLLQLSEDERSIENFSIWCKEGIDSNISSFEKMTPLDIKEYINRFHKNGIYCFTKDDNSQVNSPVSALHCLIVREAGVKGMIILEDITQLKQWTDNQINTLTYLSKIIGYHLIHLQTQTMLTKLSYTDMLTGVCNFETFHTEAESLLETNKDKNYALITCDIEHFRDINDAIGHNGGDTVIINMALSIQEILKSCEITGRVSADIFTILLTYEDREDLEDRMHIWNNLFQTSIKALNIPIEVFVVSGVYPIKNGEADIPSMIDKANAARRLLKGSRSNTILYYDDILHEKLMFEKELEKSMLSSLKNEDFLVFLQPKINLSEQNIAGAEALVRWNHPVKGFILPSDFIPLFEKNRFIINLDFYVFEKVCALIRKWINNNTKVVPVAVNFSRVHLLTSDFIKNLLKIVRYYGISTNLLEIEITESAFIDTQTDIQNITRELKQNGFVVSMDDFGSGYSSLNALKDIPIDVLKLDKDFFQNDIITRKEEIIIEGFVEMAKKMNLRVVSEGIETEMQANFLREIECDYAQGYYFAKPLPVKDFEQMLNKEVNVPGI